MGSRYRRPGSGGLRKSAKRDRIPVDVDVESQKAVTYYCRRNDKGGRLECEVVFNAVEMRMFRKGPEAYLLLICKEPEHNLNKAGAIPPFEYRCTRTGVGETYMLTVGEIG